VADGNIQSQSAASPSAEGGAWPRSHSSSRLRGPFVPGGTILVSSPATPDRCSSAGDTLLKGEPLPALMRILIADDNRDVRRGVAKILSSRPSWEICGEAQDGAEAIQKATELLPDLILLDLSMPGLSGMEVAQALRETVGNAKIVIMSQNDPTILLPIALQAGAHACIDKSRLVADLVPTLEKIQRHDRPAQG